MIGLTRRHHDCLAFISKSMRENEGFCPSYDEIMRALGLKSKSGVQQIIKALEERGHIRRLPNRARAIEVLVQPQITVPVSQGNWNALYARARHEGRPLERIANEILNEALGGAS